MNEKPSSHSYRISIQFESQGAILRGEMYMPHYDVTSCPTIIMAHGFSTTTRMTADKYAEKFRQAGFVVLLYDHRNLGNSGGEPRQEINYSVQARGYIDCIDFAEGRPEVDTSRMAIWGCSSSARLVHLVGSIDKRPKAIVAQVPAFGVSSGIEDPTNEAYNYIKDVILSENIYSYTHKTTAPIRVVSLDQEHVPSYLHHKTAAHWFLEYGTRLDTGWINRVTLSRVKDPVGDHPIHSAEHIKASVLLVVAVDDEIEGADPSVVKEVYDRIQAPKSWVSIEGGHFGLLHYPSPIFDQVLNAEIEFLRKHL